MSEQWNSGGAVTEAEENDRVMTKDELKNARRSINEFQRRLGEIQRKLALGAPIAAEKTFNDLDGIGDFIGFIWNRVKDFESEAEKNCTETKEAVAIRCLDPEKGYCEQDAQAYLQSYKDDEKGQ